MACPSGFPVLLWLLAGYLSRQTPSGPEQALIASLGVAGLLAPALVAVALVWPDPQLRRDFVARLVNVRQVPMRFALLAVGLLPLCLLIATTLSLSLGYSTEHFQWRAGFSFASGLIPAWITLALAPLLEELAWHGYGTDTLVSRWTLWRSSLVFALIWAIWHVPLGTIEGYYQAEVVETGWLSTVNFLVSVFPFVIVMNWIYYRSSRNILVTMIFHLCANFGIE